MIRKYLFLIAIAGLTAGVIALVGCSNNSTASSEEKPAAAQQSDSVVTLAASSAASSIDGEEEHAHVPGAHGGIIVSLGRDSYHVEAVFEKGGLLHLYMLGSDETVVSSSIIRSQVAKMPEGALLDLPGARHEIFMERPEIQAEVWSRIDGFLASVPARRGRASAG